MKKRRKITVGRSLQIVKKFFPKVSEVVDATKDVTIEVTKRDQSIAHAREHSSCAMAVACKRALALDGVIISISAAYLVKGEQATRYAVPEQVRREIVAFDRGASFAPGDYRLITPNHPVGKARSPGDNGTHSGNGKATPPKHFTEGIRAVLGSRRAVRITP
jgi:hypothetical protein